MSPTLTAHHKRDNGGDEAFVIAPTLKAAAGKGGNYGPEMPMVAATLSKGSAASPGVNPPGRRQEDDVNLVAFHATQDPISGSVVPAMGHEPNGVNTSNGVRRLTPRECERLQGFPEDWTLIPGLKCPDSRRYAAMGNAVTTNVAEWIGRRIHAISTSGASRPVPENKQGRPHASPNRPPRDIPVRRSP